MSLTFTINEEDALNYLVVDSLTIDDDVNSRNTCSFSLVKNVTDLFDANIGESVQLQFTNENNTTITLFAGTIENVTKVKPWNDDVIFLELDCVDFNWLADKRIVSADYRNTNAGLIVKDLIADFLEPEGVTEGNIGNGLDVEKVIFNYSTVAEALDDLADLVGYTWNIDYNKQLHFTAFASIPYPLDFTEAYTGIKYRNLQLAKSRSQYRNRQYIRGGEDTTNTRVESFSGDGERTTFTLNFRVAEKPSAITVNGSPVTYGIRGLESGREFYWSISEKEITQDDSGTALTTSDTLEVTYTGKFPIVIVSSDGDKQGERAGVEGGTGFYESVETNSAIESSNFASEYADSLIRKFGFLPEILSFEVDIPTYFSGLTLYGEGIYNEGLYPEGYDLDLPIFISGYYINVNIPSFDVDAQFLVDSVSTIIVDRDRFPRQRVKLVSGEHIGGWQNFYKKLVRLPGRLSVRTGEIINDGATVDDTVAITESLASTQAAPETRVGFATVDFSETGVI